MPILGSSFVSAVHYTSTTYGDAHYLDYSNPNDEHHLPQQVANLTSALAYQITLVNQLLEHMEMQRAPDEVSSSRTRTEERDSFQRRLGKEPFSPPRTMHSGSVHSRLGPRGNVFSRLDAQKNVHSRLGSRVNVHSRFTPTSTQDIPREASTQG